MPLSRYKRKEEQHLDCSQGAVLLLFTWGLLLVCDHFDLDESALGEGLDSNGRACWEGT